MALRWLRWRRWRRGGGWRWAGGGGGGAEGGGGGTGRSGGGAEVGAEHQAVEPHDIPGQEQADAAEGKAESASLSAARAHHALRTEGSDGGREREAADKERDGRASYCLPQDAGPSTVGSPRLKHPLLGHG